MSDAVRAHAFVTLGKMCLKNQVSAVAAADGDDDAKNERDDAFLLLLGRGCLWLWDGRDPERGRDGLV